MIGPMLGWLGWLGRAGEVAVCFGLALALHAALLMRVEPAGGAGGGGAGVPGPLAVEGGSTEIAALVARWETPPASGMVAPLAAPVAEPAGQAPATGPAPEPHAAMDGPLPGLSGAGAPEDVAMVAPPPVLHPAPPDLSLALPEVPRAERGEASASPPGGADALAAPERGAARPPARAAAPMSAPATPPTAAIVPAADDTAADADAVSATAPAAAPLPRPRGRVVAAALPGARAPGRPGPGRPPESAATGQTDPSAAEAPRAVPQAPVGAVGSAATPETRRTARERPETAPEPAPRSAEPQAAASAVAESAGGGTGSAAGADEAAGAARDAVTAARATGAADGEGAGRRAALAAQYGAEVRAAIARHRRYPADARRARLEGVARLAVTLDRAGRLLAVRVADSSGAGGLDAAALAAARAVGRYPSAPEGLAGERFEFAVPIAFRLR